MIVSNPWFIITQTDVAMEIIASDTRFFVRCSEMDKLAKGDVPVCLLLFVLAALNWSISGLVRSKTSIRGETDQTPYIISECDWLGDNHIGQDHFDPRKLFYVLLSINSKGIGTNTEI
jgi:hypothetical protein